MCAFSRATPSFNATFLAIEDNPGRYILRLLLDQNGRELAVYAVHLTLPLNPREVADVDADIGFEALLRYDEARRNAQIRRLLELLEGRRPRAPGRRRTST